MANITNIASLWTPAVWVQGIQEGMAKFPSILNSGAVVKSAVLDEIASGPGTTANVPFFKDLSDTASEIQAEDTDITATEQTSGTQIVPVLNRQVGHKITALAGAVSGASPDPLSQIVGNMTARRMKGYNSSIIATLRGVFGTLSADIGASAGCLSANLLDVGTETGLSATSDNKLTPDAVITAKALLGELGDTLAGGAIYAHPNVIATLESLDALSFKDGVQSGLPFTVRTYRGIPIFAASGLSRAGSGNGYVYETYILANGVMAYGDKPQLGDVNGVASLQYFRDVLKNNEIVADRHRYAVLLAGTRYGGTPSGQSATDAELAEAASWTLVASSAARTGAVCIRSN